MSPCICVTVCMCMCMICVSVFLYACLHACVRVGGKSTNNKYFVENVLEHKWLWLMSTLAPNPGMCVCMNECMHVSSNVCIFIYMLTITSRDSLVCHTI